MNKIPEHWLPLGTIVKVKGVSDRYIIIQRAVNFGNDFYEYGAAPYPYGYIYDKLLYCDEKEIEKVLFRGYDCELEQNYQRDLNSELKRTNWLNRPKKKPSLKDKIINWMKNL